MCRHLAWLGATQPLSSLVLEPVHELLVQSYRPRRQRHGLMNADGGSRLLRGIAARAGSVALEPTALERRVIRVDVPGDHVRVCHRGGAFRDGRYAAG